MRPIQVWRFDDAPAEIRFSDNGGDEDWLAVVPNFSGYTSVPWMEPGESFGVCCVNEYVVDAIGNVVMLIDNPDGDEEVYLDDVLPQEYHDCRIFIGCHA